MYFWCQVQGKNEVIWEFLANIWLLEISWRKLCCISLGHPEEVDLLVLELFSFSLFSCVLSVSNHYKNMNTDSVLQLVIIHFIKWLNWDYRMQHTQHSTNRHICLVPWSDLGLLETVKNKTERIKTASELDNTIKFLILGFSCVTPCNRERTT